MKIDVKKYKQLRRKAERYRNIMDSLSISISECEAAKIAYFGVIAEIVAMWEEEKGEDKVGV